MSEHRRLPVKHVEFNNKFMKSHPEAFPDYERPGEVVQIVPAPGNPEGDIEWKADFNKFPPSKRECAAIDFSPIVKVFEM